MAYFQSLQKEGVGLSDIMNVMGDSFDAVAGKSITEDMEEGGFQLTDTFQNLIMLQEQLGDNETLIEGIGGLSGAISGMGDSMTNMTEETITEFEAASVEAFFKLKEAGIDFEATSLENFERVKGAGLEFELASVASFDNIKGAGNDQREALTQMEPLLHDLKAYSEKYGISLDDLAGKLVDEAEESGALKDAQKNDTELLTGATNEMKDSLGGIIDVFTNMREVSPFAHMIAEVSHLGADLARIGRELDVIARRKRSVAPPTAEDYVSADVGYHGKLQKDTWFRLHQGEQVDVWTPQETRKMERGATSVQSRTPSSSSLKRPDWMGDDDEVLLKALLGILKKNLKNGAGDGGNLSDGETEAVINEIIFDKVYINADNSEAVLDEFMTALKRNRNGVQYLIRKFANGRV